MSCLRESEGGSRRFGRSPCGPGQYVFNVLLRIRSCAKIQICFTSRCFETDLRSNAPDLLPEHTAPLPCAYWPKAHP